MSNIGRNDPCPCGSGKKYKKCCEDKIKHKKFQASVLSSSPEQSQITQQTSRLSSLFFKKQPPSSEEEPKNPVM